MNGRHDDLADRLEQIAEELAERAIDVLRKAISDHQTGRPAEEHTLTQARRAVEKAAGLLRGSRGSDAE